MQRSTSIHTPDLAHRAGPWALAALVVGLLVLFLASGRADAGPAVDAPLTHADLVATTGGGCSSSCDDDGGSGGSGGSGSDEDDDPDPVGSTYWVTTAKVRRSVDPGVEQLIEHVNNYDDRSLEHEFSYRHRTVRSVDFSGGYARFFTLSIGGETDRTVTRTLTKKIDPWESLKIYTRLQTTRYTVYGSRYQDYDDGSREEVSRDSGPYRYSTTVLGYVTNPLR